MYKDWTNVSMIAVYQGNENIVVGLIFCMITVYIHVYKEAGYMVYGLISAGSMKRNAIES